jgi:hypothetical protein
MEGFRMDADTAEEFFRRCDARKAVTESERLAILKELVAELRAIKLNEKDLENQLRGKKVLKVGFKPPHNNGPEHRCPECMPKETK